MIVDTSALVAILRSEPEALIFAATLNAARRKMIAAPTYLESAMVMVGRKSAGGKIALDELLAEAGIEIVPFDSDAARIAVESFIRFGKGRHPAGLNFGDCISYALAKTEIMPLLFKGDDFRLTDVETAL